MKEVDALVLELDCDEIQEFANLNCGWTETEYYNKCVYIEEYNEWEAPGDGHSIIGDAIDAIRDWAVTDENLAILRVYVAS